MGDDDRYRINPDVPVVFDVAQFEREIRSARRDPQRLEEVLARYGADFGARDVLGDWHLEIRERVRQSYLDGLSVLADLHMEANEAAAATAVLERLLRENNLRDVDLVVGREGVDGDDRVHPE